MQHSQIVLCKSLNVTSFSLLYSTTYSNEIHPSVSTFMGNCRTVYSPAAIAILSNSVGTRDDTNHDGAKLTEIGMNIPVILHAQKKPACLEEVRFIRMLLCAVKNACV